MTRVENRSAEGTFGVEFHRGDQATVGVARDTQGPRSELLNRSLAVKVTCLLRF